MKRLTLLTALVWLPFLSVFGFASPALTGRVGDSYPHMVFHVLSPVLLVGALVVVRRSLVQTTARGQRVLLWILSVTITVAVVGNLLELVAAVRRFADDGWVSRATPDLFGSDAGLHTLGANLTIPGLMASMLVVLALLVTAWRGERTRSPA
jgi:hypothetical protein